MQKYLFFTKDIAAFLVNNTTQSKEDFEEKFYT
jgi:hypothetical protein